MRRSGIRTAEYCKNTHPHTYTSERELSSQANQHKPARLPSRLLYVRRLHIASVQCSSMLLCYAAMLLCFYVPLSWANKMNPNPMKNAFGRWIKNRKSCSFCWFLFLVAERPWRKSEICNSLLDWIGKGMYSDGNRGWGRWEGDDFSIYARTENDGKNLLSVIMYLRREDIWL